MDHLLRNRRLGSLATPVSNPFFIARVVYFLHLSGDFSASRGFITPRVAGLTTTAVSHTLVQTESNADSSFASIVVLNVSNINFGASAFTVMVAPRLK